MKLCWRVLAAVIGLAFAACEAPPERPDGPPDRPTKGWPGVPEIRDSAYLPIERGRSVPAGYGLYTFVLTRSASAKSMRLLAELFATTGSAPEAAIPRANLNLVMIPVRSATSATSAMSTAREKPGPTASDVMLKHYDFGQASALLANVCRRERGAEVMKVCGSEAAEGPFLVTAQRPLDANTLPGERLLVVNLGNAPPAAFGEIVAAYQRQIRRPDITDRRETDDWRLRILYVALDAAQLLPGLSKAYAGGK